jgi:hypothetical protein
MSLALRRSNKELRAMSSPLASDVVDIVDQVKGGPVDPISPADTQRLANAWMGVKEGGKSGAAPTQSGERDSAGEIYDPALHSATKAKTSDGRWRRRRGAGSAPRPKVLHSVPHEAATPSGADGRTDALDSPAPVEIRPLALATVATLTGSLVMLGGKGWSATSDEMEGMVNAWEAYYRARGVREMPPEVMLAATMGTYVMVRVSDPVNTAPFRAIYERIMQRSIPRARPNPRSNGAGQVNVAPGVVAPVPNTPGSDNLLYDRPERV